MDSLDLLAEKANISHTAGEAVSRDALLHFRAAGLTLLEAKERCGHGRWLPWVAAHLKFSERRAQRYMALAKSDVTADLESQWRTICGNDTSVEDLVTEAMAELGGLPQGDRKTHRQLGLDAILLSVARCVVRLEFLAKLLPAEKAEDVLARVPPLRTMLDTWGPWRWQHGPTTFSPDGRTPEDHAADRVKRNAKDGRAKDAERKRKKRKAKKS